MPAATEYDGARRFTLAGLSAEGSGDVDGRKRYASADYFKLASFSLFSIARSTLANIPNIADGKRIVVADHCAES
jgi:hypothetical protein